MILILSETIETSTDDTIEWLNYLGKEYIRINSVKGRNLLQELTINGGEITFNLKNRDCDVSLSDIDTVWFRRGYLSFGTRYDFNQLKGQNIRKAIKRHFNDEFQTLLSFLYQQLKTKKSLNVPTVYNMNKLIALDMAVKVGLNIPDTLITSKKVNY